MIWNLGFGEPGVSPLCSGCQSRHCGITSSSVDPSIVFLPLSYVQIPLFPLTPAISRHADRFTPPSPHFHRPTSSQIPFRPFFFTLQNVPLSFPFVDFSTDEKTDEELRLQSPPILFTSFPLLIFNVWVSMFEVSPFEFHSPQEWGVSGVVNPKP